MANRRRVTAEGQVTLRREHLGVRPGDQIVFDLLPSQRAEIHAASTDLSGFFECLPAKGKSVSIEEINEAIEDGWAGRREDHT